MVTENREASCAERIGSHRDSRLKDMRGLLKVAQGDAEQLSITELESLGLDAESAAGRTDDDALMEQAQDRIHEYPLGYSRQISHRVELSTGGPADWLEVTCDPDDPYNPRSIRYHFADWFDHADIALEGDDFDTARDFCESLGIFEPTE